MEGMFSFVGIIVIVFGILQIILFFKMWGMTNDVKEMKTELVKSNSTQLNKAVLKGDKIKIEEILFNSMYNKIQHVYCSYGYDADFSTRILGIKDEYKEKYKKYNIDFPEAVDLIKSPEDIDNL